MRKPYLCKFCGEDSPDSFYGSNRSRCITCYKKKYRQRGVDIRNETLIILGNRCNVCGFDDKRALQIDHVYDNGADERRNVSKAKYYAVILSRVRDGSKDYQLLCANCNAIKSMGV